MVVCLKSDSETDSKSDSEKAKVIAKVIAIIRFSPAAEYIKGYIRGYIVNRVFREVILLARTSKTEIRTEYIDISSDEVKQVIEGIAKAVDGMVHDFGFAMSVMDDIAKLMHKSPPDLEMVRIMLDKFFDIYVPDPDDAID